MKTICFAICVVALCCRNSYGIFIDFRGLVSPVNSASAGSVAIQFSSSGVRTSTATRFGIDRSGPNDVPDLIDGGSGFAESIGILFNRDVFVDSILISEFGATDAGQLSIKGDLPIALQNGVNAIGGLFAARSSGHAIIWTGLNAPGEGRGFSVDGLDVRPVRPDTADFNSDEAIDGHDFLIWQRNFGKIATLETGDANDDRVANGSDLLIWRTQYEGTAVQQLSVVPEPTGEAMIVAAATQAFATGAFLRRSRFVRR